MTRYELCPVQGKKCYITPQEGYMDMRSRTKKSQSQKVTTSHYKCGDCRMIHMVTMRKRNR